MANAHRPRTALGRLGVRPVPPPLRGGIGRGVTSIDVIPYPATCAAPLSACRSSSSGRRQISFSKARSAMRHSASSRRGPSRRTSRCSRQARRSDHSRNRGPRAAARRSSRRSCRCAPASRLSAGQARARRRNLRSGRRAARLELAIDALHGEAKSLSVRPSAPSGCRERRQSRDLEPRIVGDRKHARGNRRGRRLDLGVLGEARAGLFGLGQAERSGRDGVDADRREQLGELARLAFVMGGDDDCVAASELSCHGSSDGELLQRDQLARCPAGRAPSAVELLLAERLGLGRALHLDDAAGARHARNSRRRRLPNPRHSRDRARPLRHRARTTRRPRGRAARRP